MGTFIYPTSQEIREIEREVLPRLTADRPIFGIMPLVEEDASVVRWVIEDNIGGLQQLRGLSGKPRAISMDGAKTYLVEPGAYGEFVAIDEVELTQRRRYASLDVPVSVEDLVMKASQKLQARFLDRVEYVGWNALLGTYTVLGQNGTIKAADTFSVQTATAAVSWATTGSATPLIDFRAVKLLGRDKGVSLGRGAKAYANAKTVNNLLNNRNASDLFGQKRPDQGTLVGLSDINRILLDSDLPEIVEYDAGYFDDNGANWTPYIPDERVIIVGARPNGTRIADYAMTRNANNPSMEPGQYTKVVDRGETEVPRVIEVHNGHNGAPRIYYPSAVVVLDTTP